MVRGAGIMVSGNVPPSATGDKREMARLARIPSVGTHAQAGANRFRVIGKTTIWLAKKICRALEAVRTNSRPRLFGQAGGPSALTGGDAFPPDHARNLASQHARTGRGRGTASIVFQRQPASGALTQGTLLCNLSAIA